MLKATETLGRFITVRQDGKGDFKTIQAAIDAAPPNSLIEIQDKGPYNERLAIPRESKGITLRGKKGIWPVLKSAGATTKFRNLVEVHAADTLLERLVVVHNAAVSNFAAIVHTERGSVNLRSSIVIARGPHGGVCFGTGYCEVENCFLVGRPWALGGVQVGRNTIAVGNVGAQTLENVVITGAVRERRGANWRFCTILKGADLSGSPNVLCDCIVSSVRSSARDTRIDYCDVFGGQRFVDFAKPGKRCFIADPQFRDPKNFDYQLKPTSPCRGKASDGGDIGCRYTPEMLEMLKLALELRRKGIIKF